MKKQIILSLLFFSAGFLVHAFFFPEVLSNGVTDVKRMIVPDAPTNTTQATKTDPLITTITFNGTHFSKHNITISFTRYLQITNDSEQLMSLISDVPDLTTPRGYGQSEAVKTQFNKKGQFVVADKNNPQEKLVITVK